MRKCFLSFLLCLVTLWVLINHLGTVAPREVSQHVLGLPGIYIEKTPTSHRHVILQGPDAHMGYEYGRLVEPLLLMQEKLMVSKLDGFIGNSFIQSLFFTAAMAWFHDADEYIDESSLREMQGVGEWAPKQFDYLANGFTRQVAYHGLHEVGQMFVDEDRVDMGCFVSAIPTSEKAWIIGRNFDFDVDGLFDREKILKWVFPENGLPYLSVIWAGMVGAVTGVNQEGIFVSINAAGSDDFARVGTPTTIVVKNILTSSRSLEEAITYLEKSSVFITDIFVIADRKNHKVAIVEKSPKKMSVRFLNQADVIANHLTSDIWKGDSNNENRKANLTTEWRHQRGLELLKEKSEDPLESTIRILRDKKLSDNRQTHLGNRGAIDSLIASQSVIYDAQRNLLYVNLGPGTQGKYLAYDLEKSFALKKPVVSGELPAEGLSANDYEHFQDMMREVTQAKSDLKNKKCETVAELLPKIKSENFVHYDKERLLGDYADFCLNDRSLARSHWQKALSYFPPYAKQRLELQEKLK